ncbi:MAG: glycosyltransferase [Edaphocola sp.]
MQPLVSVIIPTKNSAHWLPDFLAAYKGQTIASQIEFVFIDSGSTDRTLDILRAEVGCAINLINIPPNKFNHGLTRNLGVQKANGQYVLLTVQDAMPTDRHLLEKLLTVINSSEAPQIVAACGRQIVPHDADKNPVEWSMGNGQAEAETYRFPHPSEFDRLTPQQQIRACKWDNVCALYRKEILVSIPFREVMFAEDALWAKDALLNGHKIAYAAQANVYHYHYETYDFVLKRQFTTLYHMNMFFGYQPPLPEPPIMHSARLLRILFCKRRLTFANALKWWRYNMQKHKATLAAHKIFTTAYAAGGQPALDNKHRELCSTVPQAPTPNIR